MSDTNKDKSSKERVSNPQPRKVEKFGLTPPPRIRTESQHKPQPQPKSGQPGGSTSTDSSKTGKK
jgi:hypothetical protein